VHKESAKSAEHDVMRKKEKTRAICSAHIVAPGFNPAPTTGVSFFVTKPLPQTS